MNSDYSDLIDKIRLTGNYIDNLARIESQMSESVENNNIDVKVHDLLEKCIDDINKIYINDERNAKIVALNDSSDIILHSSTIKLLNEIDLIDNMDAHQNKDKLMSSFSLYLDDATLDVINDNDTQQEEL